MINPWVVLQANLEKGENTQRFENSLACSRGSFAHDTEATQVDAGEQREEPVQD